MQMTTQSSQSMQSCEKNSFFDKIKATTPRKAPLQSYWQQLYGLSTGLAIDTFAEDHPTVVITADVHTTSSLENELHFFSDPNIKLPIYNFPDYETLPYDHFSPHQDIISQRLTTLYHVTNLKRGVLLVAANTLMQYLPPPNYLTANSFMLQIHEELKIDDFRRRLENNGYGCVSKVAEHGEFAIRGSIIDIFPMGSPTPFRIDLFDQHIESIRTFDPETQLSNQKIDSIRMLPAKEYPLTPDAIKQFRQSWRSKFIGDPKKCPIYQNISAGITYPGIESYLPLFFEQPCATIFDYFPPNTTIIRIGDTEQVLKEFYQKINDRYDQLSHDQSHPLLPIPEVFLTIDKVFQQLNQFSQILINPENYKPAIKDSYDTINFNTQSTPSVDIESKAKQPLHKLQQLIANTSSRLLLIAESAGRRESLLELLQSIDVQPTPFKAWHEFLNSQDRFGIAIAPLTKGMWLTNYIASTDIMVITETQLFGQQIMQRRLRKRSVQDSQAIVRDLCELHIGSPVVHVDHGIGRYQGLQTIQTDNCEAEFLVIEYANNTKLYLPVAALNLISRFTGIDAEHAPLNHLGSKQWEKTKREACEKIRDVAAEILEVYAQRESSTGFSFTIPNLEYQRFANSFAFELTPDQQYAIDDVIKDMQSSRCMDRLICGDVGFGKTEVAMRAAFIATQNHKQVAVLTPTTLLAQQHFTNFQDRFADWPIKVEMLSRFRTAKEQQHILKELQEGKIDIIIGTHKLLQPSIRFDNLGLLIVDEEHRFGVSQKEKMKALRPNLDILTLTATPIPRTLNMAFANIRDFSIIATPPERRLSIKTFVHQKEDHLIKEALSREIIRGGQVYFLHNDIVTIKQTADHLQEIIPTARIAIAHGQMREHQLEQIMRDFYHQRINLLVCTTIIESGIDIPTANTIIIDRADRFGLAQLHQLRGRVGRSHHQAYAYLLTPPPDSLTPDAKKRLDAIVSMEDLGAGFALATHDLEIRGAGELLGEEQSGQIQSIGFSLYMEYLERAVNALKKGEKFDLGKTSQQSLEINLQVPAIIPTSYLNDVNLRLILYKRIASAETISELDELQVEMIDRFGMLPNQIKNLFKIAELKQKADKLGVTKITASQTKGNIEFNETPNINPQTVIKLIQQQPKQFKLKAASRLEVNFEPMVDADKIQFFVKLLESLS